MKHTHSLTRPALALGLGGLALASSAFAGPQVGELVGAPSSSSNVIQARVVSSTPVVAQVAVPRQVCYDELQQQPARAGGAGALLGAIAGGAVGNAVGKGAGNALATGLGIFGGAILGDHVQNDGRQPQVQTVRRCEQQASYENRVVAYNVVYEYGGQRYSTQTTQEPGATIPLQVSITPAVPGPDQGYQAPNAYYSPNVAPVVIAPAPYVSTVRFAPEVVYRDGWWGAPRGHHGRHWD
jgi:uncharacterized protein YcfJ